ncbi:MAG: DUF4434 domain-containing protein [Oscillospiraceae bacterium]
MKKDIKETEFKISRLNKKGIPLSGTFISMWLVENWDEQTWEKELMAYKEVGIEYVIFSPAVVIDHNKKIITYYPTLIEEYQCGYKQKDVFEDILKNCQKFNMKCFIGTLQDDKWWELWWDNSITLSNYAWFINAMEQSNRLAEDIYKKYSTKYKDTMYGWYFIPELWNFTVMKLSEVGRSACVKMLCDGFNTHLDFLTELDSSMPILLSPFANMALGSYQDLKHMWADIITNTNFRKGDILCPQDSVGAGGTKLDQLEEVMQCYEYAKELKPNLRLWANNEDFDQTDWSSATMERFIKQVEISGVYAEKNITFAYNNYHSPINNKPDFHQAYKHYFETGCIKIKIPESVENLKWETLSDKIVFSWSQPNVEEIAGYIIYKNIKTKYGFLSCNKEKIGTVKLGFRGNNSAPPNLKTVFEYKNSTEKNVRYSIVAHDYCGNNSLEKFVDL